MIKTKQTNVENYLVSAEVKEEFRKALDNIGGVVPKDSDYYESDANRKNHCKYNKSRMRTLPISRYIQPVHSEATFSFHLTNNKKELKKLQSRKYPIDANIDLHGYSLEESVDKLTEFIDKAIVHGWRVVKIVHGKGNIRGHSIIKSHMPVWLREYTEVIAFVSCAGKDGGSGATKVLLKCSRYRDTE